MSKRYGGAPTPSDAPLLFSYAPQNGQRVGGLWKAGVVDVNAPHGPCVFGLAGDIALYVTAERRSDGEWFNHEDVLHPSEDARLTYLPVSQIKRVELRYWTKTNETAAAVEQVQAPVVVAGPEA